jgi:hypothetical protein
MPFYPRQQRGQCILFSVVFTPPTPRHLGSYLISLGLDYCIHKVGEVSWEPKRRLLCIFSLYGGMTVETKDAYVRAYVPPTHAVGGGVIEL